MKKTICLIILLIIFLSPIKALEINSKNAIMYNLNDDMIIYEKDAYDKVSIASLTKIMTSIITIENANLDDQVTITWDAFKGLNGYAQSGFKYGDKVTIRDLLYGLMLPSGAEAGMALSLNVTDSKEEFINLMNQKVQELNLQNTHFDNVIGMDSDNNYSTAYDLSIILKYALENDQFKEIYTAKEYTTSNNLKFIRTLEDYAKGLDISIIDGDKTGYTPDALYCLSSIATLDGINYLIITLGAKEPKYYIEDHNNLYNYFKDNYSYITILNNNQLLKSIPIKNGKISTYDIYSNKEIKKYLKNDIDLNKIEYIYDGIDFITKEIKLNDKLGTIKIKYDDEVLDSFDVFLDTKIEYKLNIIYKILIGFIVIIVFVLFIKIIKKYQRVKKYRKEKQRALMKKNH